MKIPLIVIEQYSKSSITPKQNIPVNTLSATTNSVEQSHPTKMIKSYTILHQTVDTQKLLFFLEQGLSKWEKQKMV